MKILVYTTAVNSLNRAIKDTSMIDLTYKSWVYWCKKNNCDFHIIDEPKLNNTSPHWFRYFIFDEKPGYDRYLYIDADIIVKWDAPNIFDQYTDLDKIYAVRDNFSLAWVYEGLKGYKKFFEKECPWDTYFNSGVLLFSKNHQQLFKDFIQFYKDNQQEINLMQSQTLKKGYDQTPFNYFVINNNIDIELISEKFNLSHLMGKQILNGGYFIDMGYFWHFNGFPRQNQINMVSQIWNHVKDMYND